MKCSDILLMYIFYNIKIYRVWYILLAFTIITSRIHLPQVYLTFSSCYIKVLFIIVNINSKCHCIHELQCIIFRLVIYNVSLSAQSPHMTWWQYTMALILKPPSWEHSLAVMTSWLMWSVLQSRCWLHGSLMGVEVLRGLIAVMMQVSNFFHVY